MLELFLVTIAAISTLALLVFLCAKNKYHVQDKMRKNQSLHESKLNELENHPRKGLKKNGKPKHKKNGKKLPNFKLTEQNNSLDIEKGLSNSVDSYSPQRLELDKDSTTSLLTQNDSNSLTQQDSTIIVNTHIASKGSIEERALPMPPHLQKAITVDYYLHRSQSDVEKNINTTQSKSNLQVHDHPLENCVSKRSLIPLPSTPDEANTYISPDTSVLKRGKSQGDLDIASPNIDLGYEALTIDRTKYKKRHQEDIMKEMAIQENYARPKHYAQLKKNSYHGSLCDVTPPNSARTTKSFDFQQKNSKNKRGRSISIDFESSPQDTEVFPIETNVPNQYASELKPIFSVIISNMNREILDDSVSPIDELNYSPNHRNDSPVVSEIHENSIYDFNEIPSTLSSQDTQTSEGSGLSDASKKRYTNASSSSEGNFSNHENCLYESIEDDLGVTMLGSDISNKSYSIYSHITSTNSYGLDSELERSDSGKQGMPYYDNIMMTRVDDSDESNGTSGRSEDSSYGKFMPNPMPIEGCENYDTLTHFPCRSAKLDKWNASPSLDSNRFQLTKPAPMEQNQYDYLSEGEDEAIKPNLSGRTRSIHDYERINEADLLKLKPELVHKEIGPF